MADPVAIDNALRTVAASAAHLESIGQLHDEEFRRLLGDIAHNLRLLTALVLTFDAMTSAHHAAAA